MNSSRRTSPSSTTTPVIKFNIRGEELNDSALYYWSMIALSRAIRFHAEANEQLRIKAGYVLAAIGVYYSTFHLGMFLLYSTPQFLDSRVRRKLNNRIQDGDDPRLAVSHFDVDEFLKRGEESGLDIIVRDLFKRSQDIRVFSNYGPDLKWSKSRVRVLNTTHHVGELTDIFDAMDSAFVAAIEWACEKNSSSPYFIPTALDQAEAFFEPNAYGSPFYAEWSNQAVLDGANQFRRRLRDRARKKATVVATRGR